MVKLPIKRWFRELSELSSNLRSGRLTDVEFQSKMEDLYKRTDLRALCDLVKLNEIEKMKLPTNGALRVDGLPAHAGFGKQVFGCKNGRSIVPHGHTNMCTGFIVLRGKWHGRHYDRVQSHADHWVIKPTIDRRFEPGDYSTTSDHKDNIHWFKAESDAAYVFNVYVIGYDPAIKASSGRLYLDVEGEKLSGGLVNASKMLPAACHNKYG